MKFWCSHAAPRFDGTSERELHVVAEAGESVDPHAFAGEEVVLYLPLAAQPLPAFLRVPPARLTGRV